MWSNSNTAIDKLFVGSPGCGELSGTFPHMNVLIVENPWVKELLSLYTFVKLGHSIRLRQRSSECYKILSFLGTLLYSSLLTLLILSQTYWNDITHSIK